MDSKIIIIIIIIIVSCCCLLSIGAGIGVYLEKDTLFPSSTTTTTKQPKTSSSSSSSSSPSSTPSTSGSSTSGTSFADYIYRGNNGSVSGDSYCKGGWESSDGKDKNMTCVEGVILTSGEKVNCTDIINKSGLAYKCTVPSSILPSITVPLGPILQEGQTIACGDNPPPNGLKGGMFRYEKGKLRYIPSDDIAAAWGNSWSNATNRDCSKDILGEQMTYAAPFTETGSIACESGYHGGGTFKQTDTGLKHYPNPLIASSWDKNWANTTNKICLGHKYGGEWEFNNNPNIVSGNNGTASGDEWCAKQDKNCLYSFTYSDGTGQTNPGDYVDCSNKIGSGGNADLRSVCGSDRPKLSKSVDYWDDDGKVNGYKFCQGLYGSSNGQNKNLGCSYGIVYKSGNGHVFNEEVDCKTKTGTKTAYKCEQRAEKNWNNAVSWVSLGNNSGAHINDSFCSNDVGKNYYHVGSINEGAGARGVCANYSKEEGGSYNSDW